MFRAWQRNNGGPDVLLAQNVYNELGQLIKKRLGFTDDDISYQQAVDFKYHERGWLTHINDPEDLTIDSEPEDLFAMQLYYNEGHSELNAPPQYNGNISAAVWATNTSVQHGFGYQYDAINQLTNADYDTYLATQWGNDADVYSVQNLDYDLNGNIQTLDRRSPDGVTGNGYIDRLSYFYSGNKLIGVVDGVAAHHGYDFKDNPNWVPGDPTNEYAYDANGNMTRDDNKGITVEYNELNLPTRVDFGITGVPGSSSGNKIEWTYNAAGAKLKKVVYSNDSVSETTDYAGSFIYKDNALAFFQTQEGRVVNNAGTFEYQYAIKDHLGNTRVLFKDDGTGIAVVEQESHYYPFGLQLAGLGSTGGSPENKFLYNGKEMTDEHGLYHYDFGWRDYDPQIARWTTPDPADEFYSPYVYVGNMPINAIDPDGQAIVFAHTELRISPTVGVGLNIAGTIGIVANDKGDFAFYTAASGGISTGYGLGSLGAGGGAIAGITDLNDFTGWGLNGGVFAGLGAIGFSAELNSTLSGNPFDFNQNESFTGFGGNFGVVGLSAGAVGYSEFSYTWLISEILNVSDITDLDLSKFQGALNGLDENGIKQFVMEAIRQAQKIEQNNLNQQMQETDMTFDENLKPTSR